MKKFIVFLSAIVIAVTGCQSQKESKTPLEYITIQASESERVATTSESSEAAAERHEALPQPATSAPAPAPTPAPPQRTAAPAPPPQAPALPSLVDRGPGEPPAVLLSGNYVSEDYAPAVHDWAPGFMLRVANGSPVYQLISATGAIPLYRKAGQCVDGLDFSNGACPFAARIDRDSGQIVILLKPGKSAFFVVDENACPPNGAHCDVGVEAVAYSTRVPRSKRLPARPRQRTLRFTGAERLGLSWDFS